MQRRFTSTTFLLTGALLVWLADFAFVYVFGAIACARGFADAEVFGLPLVPTVTTLATLSAGALTLWLLRRAQQANSVDEPSRFIGFVTLATSVIALVALLMLLLPPLLIKACPQP